MIGKAAELCEMVKSLGANYQAATEKGDNEAFSLMRSLHESAILGLTNVVKYSNGRKP